MLSTQSEDSESTRRTFEAVIQTDFKRKGFSYCPAANILGKGSFGVVFKCVKDEQVFAAKVVSNAIGMFDNKIKRRPWSEAKNHATQECTALRTLTPHPNLIKLETFFAFINEIYVDDSPVLLKNIYMVLEYAENRSLGDLVLESGPFKEDKVKYFARDLVKAVEYMHSKGIFHMDIKPGNAMLCMNPDNTECEYILKLGDFNLSTTELHVLAFVGSPQTMSPELLTNYYLEKCNLKHMRELVRSQLSDWWSVGATIFYALHGFYPITNDDDIEKLNPYAFKKKISDVLFAASKHLSPSANTFLEQLLRVNPVKRVPFKIPILQIWIDYDDQSRKSSFEEVKLKVVNELIELHVDELDNLPIATEELIVAEISPQPTPSKMTESKVTTKSTQKQTGVKVAKQSTRDKKLTCKFFKCFQQYETPKELTDQINTSHIYETVDESILPSETAVCKIYMNSNEDQAQRQRNCCKCCTVM